MSDLHLVIFDCDGTLVDGQHLVIAAMKEAFLRHGLEAPDDRATRRVIGLSLKIAVASVLGPEQEHLADEVTETFKVAFHEFRLSNTIGEPFYEGARELVEKLSKRDDVLLAIATGKSLKGVDIMLERESWQNTFVSLQTADSAPSKPNPGMILNAMADSGVSPENTVMVGDTTFDMEMARAANTQAFGVAWGYHDVDLLAQSGAHMIMDDYAALETALNSRFAGEVLGV